MTTVDELSAYFVQKVDEERKAGRRIDAGSLFALAAGYVSVTSSIAEANFDTVRRALRDQEHNDRMRDITQFVGKTGDLALTTGCAPWPTGAQPWPKNCTCAFEMTREYADKWQCPAHGAMDLQQISFGGG